MRIAHIVSTYPPYHGGMGRVAEEYVERLRKREHEVDVFVPAYEPGGEDPAYIHRLPSFIKFGNAAFVPQLIKDLSEYDVVHLHYPFFGGMEPLLLRYLWSKLPKTRPLPPLVMTYHMDPVAEGWKGAVFHLSQIITLPLLAKMSKRILVSSRDYAKHSDLKSVSSVQNNIAVHPFGIDTTRFSPGEERATIRKKLSISKEDVVFVFVGGLDPAHYFKGLSELISACERLQRTGWQLLIVGDGSLRPEFEARVSRNYLVERVHFLGSVTDEELVQYYQMADVHCFPSTAKAEAFGIVALEAAASGLPSIASSLPGVRSVVIDRETGILIPPKDIGALADAMRYLIKNPSIRQRLGNQARKRAIKEFDWDKQIDRLEKVYKEVSHP